MNRIERLRADALASSGTAAERRRHVEHDLDCAIARALHWGASWAEIGEALGVTRQSAHRRYRHIRWDPDAQTCWSEPPPDDVTGTTRALPSPGSQGPLDHDAANHETHATDSDPFSSSPI